MGRIQPDSCEKREDNMITEYDYKQKKISLGSSDIATLIAVGIARDFCTTGVCAKPISMGSDGKYSAYIVTDATLVPDYYHEVFSCEKWLRVYDDDALVFDKNADSFRIYRSGDFGVIILVEGERS